MGFGDVESEGAIMEPVFAWIVFTQRNTYPGGGPYGLPTTTGDAFDKEKADRVAHALRSPTQAAWTQRIRVHSDALEAAVEATRQVGYSAGYDEGFAQAVDNETA